MPPSFRESVVDTLEYYGLSSQDDVKSWYDGFIFGSKKGIYNPWSIINYAKKKKLAAYWADSSSNNLVGKLIANSDSQLKRDVENLIQGKSITTLLEEQIVFSKLYYSNKAVWSLLLAGGYIKPIYFNSENNIYEISLTNHESQVIIESQISEWFIKVDSSKNYFKQALLNNDIDEMNEYMSEIAESTFSNFDITKNNAESFYHAFVLGLVVDLKGKYNIRSNRESGFGRYDICLFPNKIQDHGIIIEFKVMRPKKESNLQKTCFNALQQIRDKHYVNDLIQHGVSENNIYVYGFAFNGKDVLICGGLEKDLNNI